MVHGKIVISFIAIVVLFILISPFALPSSQKSGGEQVINLEPGAFCISSECHATMGRKKYKHRIGPDQNACERCHVVARPGEHRFREIPERTSALCARCHDSSTQKPQDLVQNPPQIPFSGESMNWHQPFAEGKCTICHDPHESDDLNFLKAEYPETPYASFTSGTYGLCFLNQCHQDLQNDLQVPRLLSGTKFRNGNLNLHYKHVNKKKGRTCKTCHQVHGSPHSYLIADSFAFGMRTLKLEFEKKDAGGSCKTPCHSEGAYDRYNPVMNAINSSSTPGADATQEELDVSRVREQKDQPPQN